MSPYVPGRRLAGLAARRAQRAVSEPTRWMVLSTLDATLSAADAALNSSLAREAVARIVASPLADDVLQRLVAQTMDSPELDRLVAQTVEVADVERFVGRVVDSAILDLAVARVIDSRMLDAAVVRFIDSPLLDLAVARLLQTDALWVLIDEVASSPAVRAAVSRQGLGFANQVAGAARERSRTADDRLERIAARLTRRAPRGAGGANGEPAT
jgi:hypothetical protein